MNSEKFSKPSKALKAALFAGICLFAFAAQAQESGYTPPPMFEDMTPPMVRPETQDGNIVKPKSSTNTQLPPGAPPIKDNAILPRISVNPDAPVVPRSPVPPIVPTTPVPPAATMPVIAPAKPKMMQPIIEEIPKPVIEKPAKAETATPKAKTVAPLPPKKPADAVKEAVKPELAKPAEPVKDLPKKPQPLAAIPDLTAPVAPTPALSVPVPPPSAAPVPVPPKALEPEVSKPALPAVNATPAPTAKSPSKAAASASDNDRTQPVKPSTKIPRDPEQSAIQGPKTMPALPPVSVDEQVTFDEKKEPAVPQETIMERHLQEMETKSAPEPKVLPLTNVTPTSFDPGEQGVLKKSLPFQPGQIGLNPEEIDPLAAGIIKELDQDDKKDWRVQIKSFATPHGNGVSTDKRIALSRALSLRSSLIAKGVSASRIDVLAQGTGTENNGKPGDRVDLYLYGPPIE